jgi:alanine racemase
MSNRPRRRLSPLPVETEYEDPWNNLVVNLDRLEYNYRLLMSRMPKGSVLYAVVKSDAYGHGIKEVSKVLSQAGCAHFAVETPQEGIIIRNEGIVGEILLMNPIPLWMAELAVRYDLSVSVIHTSILQPLEDVAALMDKTCMIHLNINVGLHRMGIPPSKSVGVAKEAAAKPHLLLQGIFGQPREPSTALESFRRLQDIHEKMKAERVAPKQLHFANSTTFLSHPEIIANGVRLGILLYGVFPPEQRKQDFPELPVKPVMNVCTELVQIRDLDKGSRIGYRAKTKTQRDSRIGTIPIGYSHGLGKLTAQNGYVLIHGRRAPFIGTISMNSATIDITDIKEAKIGDKVVVVGKQGSNEIDVNDLAQTSGTIAGELMTRLGRGIPRQYKMESQDVMTEITVSQDKTDDVNIRYIENEKELPNWLYVNDITDFLLDHMHPYSDSMETTVTAVDYALSAHPQGRGFVLIASMAKEIIGVVVAIQTDKLEIIPENVLVYICVHRDYRHRGIGSRLITEATNCVEGNFKIHVLKTNPALGLLKKLGFKNDHFEMRFERGV